MKRHKRTLDHEEAALWRAVVDTVTPLHKTTEAPPSALPLSPSGTGKLHGIKDPAPSNVTVSTSTSYGRHAPPPAPSGLHGGDPGLARRIARGRLAIDATLDLHGMTQAEAHARLLRFVEFGRLRGDRTLLIITGKGPPSSERCSDLFGASPRGILRRRFLEWITAPPLAVHVGTVREAHQKHGGRGAFYVILKKA